VPYFPLNSPFQNGLPLTTKNSAVGDGFPRDLPREQTHNCLCHHSYQAAGWHLAQPHNLGKALKNSGSGKRRLEGCWSSRVGEKAK